MRLRILRAAVDELAAVTAYYEELRPGLGRAFLDQASRAISKIRDRPSSFRKVRGEVRVLPVARFPYRVLFRAGDDELVVVAFAHLRRRPGYWARRG